MLNFNASPSFAVHNICEPACQIEFSSPTPRVNWHSAIVWLLRPCQSPADFSMQDGSTMIHGKVSENSESWSAKCGVYSANKRILVLLTSVPPYCKLHPKPEQSKQYMFIVALPQHHCNSCWTSEYDGIWRRIDRFWIVITVRLAPSMSAGFSRSTQPAIAASLPQQLAMILTSLDNIKAWPLVPTASYPKCTETV